MNLSSLFLCCQGTKELIKTCLSVAWGICIFQKRIAARIWPFDLLQFMEKIHRCLTYSARLKKCTVAIMIREILEYNDQQFAGIPQLRATAVLKLYPRHLGLQRFGALVFFFLRLAASLQESFSPMLSPAEHVCFTLCDRPGQSPARHPSCLEGSGRPARFKSGKAVAGSPEPNHHCPSARCLLVDFY